jgi:polyisoprenoid-binding protein YceI
MTHSRVSFARIATAIAIVIVSLFGPIAAWADDAGGVRAVDVKASKARFDVSHLYVANVGGTVPIVSGSVTLPAGSAIPTRVEATLDPSGIRTGEDERDAELQDGDWFDAKRFPTWTFVGTKVAAVSPGRFTVAGTLTVHGVAQPVSLDVTIVRGLPAPIYKAVGHADRHGFGMTVTRTDALVGNDIALELDVVLTP